VLEDRQLVFVGIRGRVVALNRETGEEVWRVNLSSEFVTVLWDGDSLVAATSGEVWRLEPESGAQIWHNQLRGLRRGLVSLASTRASGVTETPQAEAHRRRAAEEAAAAAG